jgi:hypothetical protein
MTVGMPFFAGTEPMERPKEPPPMTQTYDLTGRGRREGSVCVGKCVDGRLGKRKDRKMVASVKCACVCSLVALVRLCLALYYRTDMIITNFTLVFGGMLLALAGVSSSTSEPKRVTRPGGAGGPSMVSWCGAGLVEGCVCLYVCMYRDEEWRPG